jgi:hypothetical protein
MVGGEMGEEEEWCRGGEMVSGTILFSLSARKNGALANQKWRCILGRAGKLKMEIPVDNELPRPSGAKEAGGGVNPPADGQNSGSGSLENFKSKELLCY